VAGGHRRRTTSGGHRRGALSGGPSARGDRRWWLWVTCPSVSEVVTGGGPSEIGERAGCCSVAWTEPRASRSPRRHTWRMGGTRLLRGSSTASILGGLSLGGWLLGGACVGTSLQACGGEDRPDIEPLCTAEVCDPIPAFGAGRLGDAPEDPGGGGGTGGVIENAPPAGAPAEGLGVEGTIADPPEIGVEETIGVDGVQPQPPVTRPGGAPALPGPEGGLNPPPGSAVDPVTGLVPPQEGVQPGGVNAPAPAPGVGGTLQNGTLQSGQPGAPQREPTEGEFTF